MMPPPQGEAGRRHSPKTSAIISPETIRDRSQEPRRISVERRATGSAGSGEAMLLMERGEVEGHSTSLEIVRALHPTWLSDKKITVLVQYALRRHPELMDIPLSWELGRNPEEQQILKIVANATEVGKMIMAPPAMPADRVQALRRAFDATMADPEFVAELKANRVELGPMPGEDLQKLVAELGSASPAILDKVKAIYPLN